MLDDLVERARHRRQRCELLDHRVAAAAGLAADDRVASLVIGGTRGAVSLALGAGFEQLDRKAVRAKIENIFSRGDVDRHIAPPLPRTPAEPAPLTPLPR